MCKLVKLTDIIPENAFRNKEDNEIAFNIDYIESIRVHFCKTLPNSGYVFFGLSNGTGFEISFEDNNIEISLDKIVNKINSYLEEDN